MPRVDVFYMEDQCGGFLQTPNYHSNLEISLANQVGKKFSESPNPQTISKRMSRARTSFKMVKYKPNTDKIYVLLKKNEKFKISGT